MKHITGTIKQPLYTLAVAVTVMCVQPLSAADLALEPAPLFLTSSAKPNLILAIDDSGSMDSEVLFPTNDGALWWDTNNNSFVSGGAVNFNTSGSANDDWKKFTYLFPNGTGSGNRVYADSTHNHYAIPPLPQYAYARSSEYNKMYYDPTVVYNLWASYDAATFSDITATSAPSDPISGSFNFDLTADRESSSGNHTFKMYDGMVIPSGTKYHDGSWKTASSDVSITSTSDIGISFYPATHYQKVTSDTYTVSSSVISGDCSSPTSAHYSLFNAEPGSLSGVDALGPDGSCLQKVEIKSSTTSYPNSGGRDDCITDVTGATCTYDEEIQNFANWFSYYRKRHLALRAGMGQAFDGLSAMNTGLFTINNRSDVSMWDIDVLADNNSFFSALYNIDGNSGGTPNRRALDHAGLQYKRTDANAPITAECQKNFTLLFTDGYSTTSGPSPGNADSAEGTPYADTYSNTLGDIAMKYYKERLRSTADFAAGNVFTPSGCSVAQVDPILDCNADLHMNTYTVGLGAKGTLFGVSHFEVADAYDDTIPENSPSLTWPDVTSERDARQVDDLYHAAVNGRGEMLNAASAKDLQSKLKTAILTIQSQIGVASAVTFNSATLETDSSVYLAFFNSGNWSGDLYSYALDSAGNVDIAEEWSAATNLDSLTNASVLGSGRTIITHNGTTGIPFNRANWASLNATQQDDLIQVPGPNNVARGKMGIDYIRGDTSNEGTGRRKFRIRTSRLGDIVNAAPAFVGPPSLGWPSSAPFPTADGERYVDFRAGLLSSPRTPVVYVGANDGMMHGFRSDTGAEVLAYIPSTSFSTVATEGLHYLANKDYQHRYYVDLPATISDVYIDADGDNSSEWTTILIGGQRQGGKGLFALNVTNPATFTEANASSIAMWEFTDSDLGLTFSKPTVAMMENGRWAAIFGNGYNDSGSGQATLFIVFIDGGLDGVWTDGSGGTDLDYIKISTGVGDSTTPNGLATPTVVDVSGNGAADRVYAGDLRGNLWVFDLSDNATLGSPNLIPSGWASAYTSSGSPQPLFTATDAGGTAQPITVKPALAHHPEPPGSPGDPNLMVYFGTGKYLEKTDMTDTSTQSFYGIWDHGTGGLTRSDLQVQTISDSGSSDSDGNSLRLVTDTTVNYNNTDGWYMDLPGSGERVVVTPQIRGSLVFFNTWIPDSSPCSAGGSGYLMSVEQLNGGEPDSAAFNINTTAGVDDTDRISVSGTYRAPAGQQYDNGLPAESRFLSNVQYTPGTGNTVIQTREVQDLGGPDTGRFSWQQLLTN